jgi:protein gp37
MTGISWTDETWNPVIGCSRVSEGCRNCYAEEQAARIVRCSTTSAYDELVKIVSGKARWTGVVRLMPERLAVPLRWHRRRFVFVNSMSDLFHESLTNEQIAAVFGVMAAARRHTFQILTKRSQRMREWFEWVGDHGRQGARSACRVAASALLGAPVESATPPVGGFAWPLPNVWLGISAENQEAYNERMPDLEACPAAIRYVSAEPLLGEIVLSPWISKLDWLIAGCESGRGARPCSVDSIRMLRDQCATARILFFLKQAVECPSVTSGPGSRRKRGGIIETPLLDGVQHTARPARQVMARSDHLQG